MTELITVNDQSSIRIAADSVLYFDPLSITGTPHDADIILITHDHYDHFSPDDISKVAKEETVFVMPEGMKGGFKKAGFPVEKALFMKPGESASLRGIEIETVPAYNLMKPFHPKKAGWLGYVAAVAGERVYVCGDTDDTPEARAVKCDIVCVPIGGTYTMDATSAAELVKALAPKAAIPTHYGSIVGKPADADAFEKAVGGKVKVVRKLRF